MHPEWFSAPAVKIIPSMTKRVLGSLKSLDDKSEGPEKG